MVADKDVPEQKQFGGINAENSTSSPKTLFHAVRLQDIY